VLPLDNISANATDEYFSDGMTEELISKLSRVQGLDVIARTSVMQYKRTQKSVADIGRELKVGALLEGSVRRAGDKVRITVQLIDVATQGHLWSQDFDRDLKDIFALQSEIAEQVAGAMHVKLVKSIDSANGGQMSTDPETYDLYLKGLFHAGKFTPDGLRAAISFFDRAVKKSPNDARSWAGLAKAYAMLGWGGYAPPAESFQKAKPAAERALALDETLSEAHISLGIVRFLFDWDWSDAERAYQRAIELSPASADAHLFYGVWFKAMALNDRAVAQISRANELDPLYLLANAEMGWVAYFGRRFDDAAKACRRTLDMDPYYVFAMICLQYTLTLKKDPGPIALGKRLLELMSDDPYFLGVLGWSYGVLGHKAEARYILGQLQRMPPTQPAPPPAIYYVYMGLGDRQGTLEWMEKAYAERWSDLVWMKASPEYDWVREDPRFQALLKRLKLDG
jgi:TolB-like protein/Tfp pilus assembly protein PilF